MQLFVRQVRGKTNCSHSCKAGYRIHTTAVETAANTVINTSAPAKIYVLGCVSALLVLCAAHACRGAKQPCRTMLTPILANQILRIPQNCCAMRSVLHQLKAASVFLGTSSSNAGDLHLFYLLLLSCLRLRQKRLREEAGGGARRYWFANSTAVNWTRSPGPGLKPHLKPGEREAIRAGDELPVFLKRGET